MKKLCPVLLLYISIISIPFGCSDRYPSSEIQIKSISVRTGSLEEGGYYPKFSELPAHVSDTLTTQEFAIEISIDEFAMAAAAYTSGFTLVTQAFADPAPLHSKSKITLLSITSNEKVFADGKEFEIDSNLTGLFSAQSFNVPAQGVLSFVRELNPWSIEQPIYLKVTAALDQPLSQTLRISITMDDGSEFTAETASVIVK